MPTAPVETKVKAATAAAGGAAATITPAVVWLVDELLFNGAAAPDVPLPLIGLIGLVVSGVAALTAGWWARHSPRWTAPPPR